MNEPSPAFAAHLDLLQLFLSRREAIVARIEQLLNCQKRPPEYQQDAALLSRLFTDCFVVACNLDRTQAQLGLQLEEARWASGFKPRNNPGNDIVDPVQMLIRGLHMWRQTRWPGSRGRLRYAHTLFNLLILRRLALLMLRLWDGVADAAGGRLASLQGLLDQLWQDAPTDQPRLVRDVRWLIPVATSPTTDELAGYFQVATRIAETLPQADRVEIQRAWVQTGAGHLCSQLRHLCVKRGVPLDDPGVVLLTRKSNALDVTLLMEGLVTLFAAYEQAVQQDEEQQRLLLATAICQGLSPDPELFLGSGDLLGPYTMIEHLFIAVDEAGQVACTAMGQRHLRLLQEYQVLLARLAAPLLEDSRKCRPVSGAYAPYGALYGFASNLLELMALGTLLPEAAAPYGMEDVFSTGTEDKRSWVNNWRNLPHVKPEVVQQFAYSDAYAQALHARVEAALQRRLAEAENQRPDCGRLFLVTGTPDPAQLDLPDLPVRYVVSSDPQTIATGKAVQQNEGDLLHCRLEGEFLVSYQSAAGWTGLDKDLLTEVLGEGRNAKLAGLPPAAAASLQLMCGELVVPDTRIPTCPEQ